MRTHRSTFTAAMIASVAMHALLYPAARHWSLGAGTPTKPARTTTVKFRLADDSAKPPTVVPVQDDDQQIGQAHARGTSSHPSKGDTPLQARDADQDQPSLSRNRVSRAASPVSEPDAARRGQNGTGGQVGSAIARPPAPPSDETPPINRPADVKPLPAPSPVAQAAPTPNSPTPKPPPPKVVKPADNVPAAPPSVAIKPAQIPKPANESAQPAIARTESPPAVAPTSPLVDTSKANQGDLHAAPKEGPTAPGVEKPAEPANRQIAMATPKPAVESPAPANPAMAPAKTPDAASPASPTPPVAAPQVIAQPTPTPAPPTPPSAPTIVTTGDARAPGADHSSATAAQESDSDSDAFVKNKTMAVWHDGRLDVRNGRKVKLVKPHLLLGAYGAIASNTTVPVLVLKIVIDEKGDVKQVDILQSTGSVSLDQPCRRAAFEWWFEPSHDKYGRPIPDVIPFTIVFR